MALLIEADPGLEEGIRMRIAFHVSGIVILTLFINGTTITKVYNYLQIQKHSRHHDALVEKALEEVEEMSAAHAAMLQGHWFFHNCNFQALDRLVPDLRTVVGVKA